MTSKKKHRVVRESNEFSIFENDSEQTILRFPKQTAYETARSLSDHFESGGGFGGWTPTFFLFDPKVELEKLKNLSMGPEEAVA